MMLNEDYAKKAVQLGLLTAEKAKAVVARQRELGERGTKVSVRQILMQANLLSADQLTQVDQALGVKVVMRSAKPKLPGAKLGGAASINKPNLQGKSAVAFDKPKSTLGDKHDHDEDLQEEDEKPRKKGKWKRRFYMFIFLLIVAAVFAAPIAIPSKPGVKDVLAMDNGVGKFFNDWRKMGVTFIKESEFWPVPDLRGFLNEQKNAVGFFGDWDQGHPFPELK